MSAARSCTVRGGQFAADSDAQQPVSDMHVGDNDRSAGGQVFAWCVGRADDQCEEFGDGAGDELVEVFGDGEV
jgi:hypothetical protein